MLRLTAGPTHLAGRLNINIHPLAVLTAVSYRIGDDVAVGGGFGQMHRFGVRFYYGGLAARRSGSRRGAAERGRGGGDDDDDG